VRTLYRAALVRTLTYPQTGEWLLTDGRHVERVGSGEPPTADRTVELPGATIVPGFIDTHVHLTPTGSALANADVESATSKDALLAIARARRDAGAKDVIALQGFDETRWDRRVHPTLAELDDVVGDVPLAIFRLDGHLALANRAAVAASGTAVEVGVERDDAGEPTGRLTQVANDKLRRWVTAAMTDHDIQELQLKAAGLAAARGVTAVHEMQMPHSAGLRDLQVFLGHRAQLPVDAFAIVATMDLPLVIDHGFAAVGGDLPVDGSVGARTAALSAPYDDGAGDGTLYYEDDELADFFHSGHAAGLQVGVHAIGDRAIEQVLRTWERVYQALDSRERRHFRARRHRVEHFEMPSLAHIERAAMLGLAVSVQPTFDDRWGGPGGLYESNLGQGRATSMNPVRTMLERGVEVGAGSDSPITPLDPLLSVRALEHHHAADQRLSRFEAIRMHTIGSARLAHQEEKKGALGHGMHADLVAFDADPFEAPALEDLSAVLTVSLGREVFAA
jgi:predicted amidohydrolase YtcJ